MKFAITKTSRDDYYEIRNFDTVEQLVQFMKKSKHDIIITHNWCFDEDIKTTQEYNTRVNAEVLVTLPYAIEIYNDYRE